MASAYLAEYRDLDISAVITLRSGTQITVDADDIYSYNISGTAAATGIPIGEAISNSFSMGVSAAACPYTAEALDSAEVRVRIGVRDSSSVGYKYTDAGAWYVTQTGIPEGASSITIKGADALSLWFDAKYEDSEANYPASLLGLLQTVAGLGGVTVSSRKWLHSDAALNAMPKWAEGTTLRNIVGYIAACAGGFAQINMSGELEIITNGWGDVLQLDTATYNTYTPTGGAKFRLNCLRVAFPITDEDAEEPEVVRFVVDESVEDNASNCAELSGNPLMTEAMAQAVVDELSKYEYHGCDVLWLGDPAVNCGHVLEITPLDGVKKVGLINDRQLTFDGGLSGQISSTMPTLHDTSTHYTSSGSVFNPDGSISVSKIQGLPGGVINAMLGKFDRIIAGDVTADKFFAQMGKVVLLEVQQFEADSIDADIIKAGTVTADKLAAGSVEADKVAAGAIEADAIKAGAVTAEKIAADAIITTKIKAGAITTDKLAAGAVTAAKIAAKTITAESGIIDDGAIGTAQIADGSITSAKIVELTADLIKTGTLSADRLLIAGDDGLIYKINATSSGLNVSQLTDDQYKNYINGTVIVAKSITAAQIAAKTITGNEILAGSITAKEIDVSDLFANQATIDALNTVDIRGNGYLQLLVDNLHTLKVFDGQLAQAECVDGQGVRVFSTFAPVQSGSGDPAPDNVRAISGHTCAKLVRCGKNILAPVRNWSETRTHNGITFTKNADGSIRVTGTATAQAYAQLCVKAFRFISGVPYIFTGACEGTYIQIGYFTDDTNYVIRAQSDYGEAQMVKDIDGLCRIYLIVNSGTTVNGTVYPQCEIADIATEYESYQGDAYEVDFGQTVYGGTLDWNEGVTAVERGLYTFNGSENIIAFSTGTGRFVSYVLKNVAAAWSDIYTNAPLFCSHFKVIPANTLYNSDAGYTIAQKDTEIWFSDTNFSSVDEFKAYLAAQYAAGTPVQVSFELAEPETLQLEPTQIAAADGLNTVYTDADDGRIEFGHDSLIPYLQSQIDLIPGKISLAVSTGVAAGIKAGSSIEITEEKVQISSKTTSISIPADDTTDAAEIVSIDEEGLRTTELTAEEIHSDSIVGTAAGGTYTPANAGELRALLDDLAGCCLTGDININAAAVAGGSFTIRGLHGHGVLTVTGGTVNDLKVQNCSVMVRFNNTVFESSGTAATAYNSLLYLSGATLTAAEGVYAYYGARVIMNNCKGDCETVLRATSGSVVTVAGTTCPTGALGLVTAAEVYSTVEFVEPAQAPTVSEVTTVSIAANNTRTWGGSWLSTSTFGTALYQGATGGGTLRRGCMWFPLTAISGKEIISATLTLKRLSGIGGGGSVSIGIYGTTATGASGEPAIGTKYAGLTLANGASGSVDVTAAVQALANGTIKGLMIYDDRTGTFGGKTYTYGYCKIYGTGSGVPTLNVTYK